MIDLPTEAWAALAGFGGVALSALSTWLVARVRRDSSGRRAQAEERQAEATVEVERVRAEVTVAGLLSERLTATEQRLDAQAGQIVQLHAHVDECERGRRADREEHQRQREADRAACEAELSVVRDDLSATSRLVRELRAELGRSDDTGQHQLARIEARSTPPELPAPTRREEDR